MNFIFSFFKNIVTTPTEMFEVVFLCLLVDLTLIYMLFKKNPKKGRNKAFFYLLTILLTIVFENITLLVGICQHPQLGLVSKVTMRAFFKFDYIPGFFQYIAILLLTREISSYRRELKALKWFVFPVSGVLALWYLFRFFETLVTQNPTVTEADLFVDKIYDIYMVFVLCYMLLITFKNYKQEKIALLKHQIKILGLVFLMPFFALKIPQLSIISPYANYSASVLISIFLTSMIYYCAIKLTTYRFLNMSPHVIAKKSVSFNFIYDFKDVINSLRANVDPKKLVTTTKEFFSKAFNVSKDKVDLILKGTKNQKINDEFVKNDKRRKVLDEVFGANSIYPKVIEYIQVKKLIIRDEVEYSHYYSKGTGNVAILEEVLKFMKDIDADVFIPVYSDLKLVAFIVVQSESRDGKFYSNIESEEMLILGDYLGNAIYYITNLNLKEEIAKKHALENENYELKKEVEVLKEAFQQFIHSKVLRPGVLTYKNGKFSYLNREAHELVGIDLNNDEGLDLTMDIKKMVKETSSFYEKKSEILTTEKGERLVVNTSLNLDKNNVLLTVHPLRVVDISNKLFKDLKEVNKVRWQYLIALKSTKAGRIIDDFIPTDTIELLNKKIIFLQYASTKRHILVEAPSKDDIFSIAEIIKEIRDRKRLEEIDVQFSMNGAKLEQRLFGIDKVFDSDSEPGLFEKYNEDGIIVIQNIHALDSHLQKKLYDFLETGLYTRYKGVEKLHSNVMLVFGTTQDLYDFVREGIFSKRLYFEVEKANIHIPVLTQIDKSNFLDLAENMRRQVVRNKAYKNILDFNEADKNRLLAEKIPSLSKLQSRVKAIIRSKIYRSEMKNTLITDPAFGITNPILAEARRLGRKVLYNPKMFKSVLEIFNYQQSKVAKFLNVDRSTVCRRCKDLGIDVKKHQSK